MKSVIMDSPLYGRNVRGLVCPYGNPPFRLCTPCLGRRSVNIGPLATDAGLLKKALRGKAKEVTLSEGNQGFSIAVVRLKKGAQNSRAGADIPVIR